MNPYGVPSDLFQSQANQSANSFSDPLNISHLYPGWGMNPNYQTPAYDAPYRPGYSGPDPYSFYGKPTFAGAMNQTLNPFHQGPYWGNPVDNNQQAYNSMGQKPFDAAATVSQRLIMPALAVGLTMSATKGIFGAFGAGIGHGLGAGIGSHVGAAGPMQLTSGARALGAVGRAAGWFGSLALGLAVADTADSMIFQPYIRSRQMADSVQRNFSGVTFGEDYGNLTSGRGLSGKSSARIGAEIDRIGIRDNTFSANQMGGIASMGMKAGLFDDVGAGDIGKRVSSIAAQIKTILAISKDPNIQTAIAELAKLQTGGASLGGGHFSQAVTAYSGIGMHASAAGASVQRVMATVGQQGQYMYQMNGITPYLGQMAAAQAFAGFSSARRAGVISQSAFARMGGTEGATQSALAAQLTSAQTPYSQIQNFNRFIMGNKQDGVINNVSAFGQAAAQNPLRVLGAQILHGKTMDSKRAELDGPRGPEKQATDYLDSIGVRAGPQGHDPNDIAAVLHSVVGMPEDQVRAYMAMRTAQTNTKVVSQNKQAFNAQTKEQLLQYADQNFVGNGVIATGARKVVQAKQNIFATTAELGYGVSEAAGEASDWLQDNIVSTLTGNTVKDRSKEFISPNSAHQKRVSLGTFDARNPRKKKGWGFSAGDENRWGGGRRKNSVDYRRSFLDKLNTAAGQTGEGGDIAREILNKGVDSEESKILLTKFLRMHSHDPDMKEILTGLDNSPDFIDSIAADLKEFSVEGGNAGRGDIEDYLNKAVGGSAGTVDDLRILGQAAELRMDAGRKEVPLGAMIGSLGDAKYSGLAENLKGLSSKDKVKRIRELSDRVPRLGVSGSASIAGKLNMSLDDIIKNPEKFTSNKEALASIRSAKGDRKKIGEIASKELARQSGGNLVGMSTNLEENATDNQFYGVMGIHTSQDTANQTATSASESGGNYASLAAASKSLESGAADWRQVLGDQRALIAEERAANREFREIVSKLKTG